MPKGTREQSAGSGTREERAVASSTASNHTHKAVEHAGNGRLEAGRQLHHCVERGRVLLLPSWSISPLYILCHILTLNLTNKMLMHVIKIIELKTMFKYESNDINFGDMHSYFIS